MDKKNSMLLANMMSSSGGGEPNPPANVVFDDDLTKRIEYKARDGQMYWTKKYTGLCYGGFMVFNGDGSSQNWIIALTVSEVRNNCFFMKNGRGDLTNSVSTTTFNYKGKDWYYSLWDNANPVPTSSSDIDWNKNSSPSYWIGGENTIFVPDNLDYSKPETIFINGAKALLDYVYSF